MIDYCFLYCYVFSTLATSELKAMESNGGMPCLTKLSRRQSTTLNCDWYYVLDGSVVTKCPFRYSKTISTISSLMLNLQGCLS